MYDKMPNTPFSTRLSGSAKETELRLRSIFQWKKKRPPVVLFALVAVLMLGICGGLVGFSDQQTDERYLAMLEVSGAKIFAKRQSLRSFEVYWQPDGGMPECFSTVTRAKVSTVQLTEHNGKLAVRYTDSYNDLSCIYVYVLSDDQAPEYLMAGASKPGTDPSNEVPEIKEMLGRADAPAEEPDTPTSPTPANPDVEEPQTTPKAETEADVYTLENLNLDGKGENDDSIVLTIYRVVDGKLTGKSNFSVTLGSGETLTQNYDGDGTYSWYPCLRGAHLTSTDHQSVIVELPEFGSTYGAARYYILEVVNDTLEVFNLNAFYDERSLLDGYRMVSRPDSELSCVRIPVSAGTKWNATGWGSLTWDNGQWNFTEDGYFIDTRTLTVDGGMELTLALRGRDDDYGSNGYLYYDQIQILHGETVLQTITEDSFTPDNHCPFEYFNADASFHAVLTEDINFDGNTDFGIPCNTTHNDGHVWFLYDPRTRQYRFAFSLAGIPTIDEEKKQIMEEWWDDSVYITYNTYEFNADGQLILIESCKEA